jgi:RNA polymerase sigma factor (sigma-70 family)
MRRSDNDLLAIPERELRNLSQDELVRLVVICRDGNQSNRQKGKTAWRTLVASDYDRIRNTVATFGFPGHADVRIARSDVDDVVHQAYERLAEKLFESFRGTSPGEYGAAARTCTYYECMDHCRDKMKDEQTRAGSIDETIEGEGGGSQGRFDKTLAKMERKDLEDEEADRIAQWAARAELERVEAALEQFENPQMAEVLRLTWRRRPVEAIATELGTTAANVYQLRRRGLKKLKKILDGDGEADDKNTGDE